MSVKIGMHASLWAATWSREAAELAVPEAAEHGLEVIEFPLLVPEAIDAAHSRKLFDRYGIEPTASLCLPEDKMAQVQPEKAEAFLIKALDKAHEVGTSYLGGVTYSALGFRSGKPPTEAEYANMAKALKPAARHARKLGITLGLEPCNRYETHLLNTSTQALRFLELLDEPNVTIHLDTYHMNIEEKGIGAGFRNAGSHCAYVHLSESDRGVPGTGTIDWDDIFRTLADIGFTGRLVVESFVTLPPEIAAALSVWRPVARDRQEVLAKGLPFLKGLAKVHGLA
ncbi:MAG: sugar phosphate isomerase/epimerase [Rhizobiales bacterium]|nr:sugar phosphate isomerase/epimerase [Hyphomicrobiales bacterium]MBI3671950.1 sugar phosphate isomerase/epimerase [Hyphomicrobiales bacterium]